MANAECPSVSGGIRLTDDMAAARRLANARKLAFAASVEPVRFGWGLPSW
jgi:hypothetical protein